MTIFSQLQKLKWGTFGAFHIITILLSIATPFILYFALKNKSVKTQKICLFILSLTGISAICYNLLMWGSPLEYLPLHLCSINALILPFAILTSNKLLANLLPLFSIGALAAIILNTGQTDYTVFSWVFAFYYIPHTFEFAIPFVLLKLGVFKNDTRYILPSVGLTFSIYTVAHVVNTLINNANIPDGSGSTITVNYMYSISPQGIPLISHFWTVCPHEYFYMLFLIPIVALFYLLMNINTIITKFNRRIDIAK